MNQLVINMLTHAYKTGQKIQITESGGNSEIGKLSALQLKQGVMNIKLGQYDFSIDFNSNTAKMSDSDPAVFGINGTQSIKIRFF